MATTLTNYLENEIADHICGVGSYTMPTTLRLAIFTTNPDFETGSGGTEATGGGYSRKAIAFDPASGGVCYNTSAIEWTAGTDITAATAYTGWGVYDAASSGNLLFGDTFGSSKTPASGEKLRLDAAALSFQVF